MQTVKVRLRKPYRVFTFLSRDIPLEREDTCIVRSDRGLEYGVCTAPPEACDESAEERYKMNVVRKATDHDETTFGQMREDEDRARALCAEKIRERKLPMKFVEVECSFDRRKIIFYFTAEDRVDFRELVRDLANELKTRIELRHIQVRDEAKMVGGIGTCGRELCCSSWLKDFVPISMKMAKRQNLSLNPGKISGQCGRLMCCLSYENSLYSNERKARSKPPLKDEEASPAPSRDKVEAETPAAQVSSKTDLSAVAPENIEETPNTPQRWSAKGDDSRPRRRDRSEARAKKDAPSQPKKEGESAEERRPAAKSGESNSAQSRPKRRRRRRRRSQKAQDGGGPRSGQGGGEPGSGKDASS